MTKIKASAKQIARTLDVLNEAKGVSSVVVNGKTLCMGNYHEFEKEKLERILQDAHKELGHHPFFN